MTAFALDWPTRACWRALAQDERTVNPTRADGLHRTGAPVLRGGLEAGTFEESFFAVPAPRETDRLLAACRRARAPTDAWRGKRAPAGASSWRPGGASPR